MSNNLYDILNKFNSVEQTAQQAEQPKAKTKLAENMETVEGQLSEKYMGFKKTVAAIKKGGSAENPEAVAAAIGRKKYGKEKFQQAAAQGKKLGEQGVAEGAGNIGNSIKALYQKIYNAGDDEIEYVFHNSPFFAHYWGEYEGDLDSIIAEVDPSDLEVIKAELESYLQQAGLAEVAPPGAKAERMVKHIKKSYAKDGKLTPKEKSIAYATAWKAHNAGKVEEAAAAIKTLVDSGMTKQQIAEGWEDMMKAAKARSAEKGTGKFDKKQISTGTVYTRKYDPKTGETDDTENVTAVKRGRGRPKKSAFESFAEQYEQMLEGKDQSQVPGSAIYVDGKPLNQTQQMGTVKGGVWTADAPKAGEKGTPVPSPVDEEMTEMMRLAGLDEVSKGEYIKQQDAKAEKAGKGTFKAFGQEFSTDEVDEAQEVCNECGMYECGCGDEHGAEEGHTSISMNMDNDGHQSVSVNADGEDAVKLAQLLKLAGLGNGGPEAVYQPVEVEVDEEEVAEEFANEPEEEVFGTEVQLHGGNGDVAGQEKHMSRDGAARFSDNPMAMRENLVREYESIKVKK